MRCLVLFLMIALISGVAHSQSAVTETQNVSAQATVEEAERAWAKALMLQDIEKISSFLDPRFQLIMSNSPGSSDRDAYLLLSAERAYTSMIPNNVGVYIYADVAVATVDMQVGWPEGFPPLHDSWRFTDTWLRTDGAWQVVTRVAQPTSSAVP